MTSTVANTPSISDSHTINNPVTNPWSGRLALLFVGLFAFILASFPARNSDVWLHLASGRELVHGQVLSIQDLSGQTDPRISQNWLYAIISYGVYSLGGQVGLVLAKAFLVVGLALLLWRLSLRQSGLLIPTLSVALALLAMGNRFLLQPSTVSYFLLTLSLVVLWQNPVRIKIVPLLILFLIWVNFDGWYLLGYLVVSLVLFGRLLDRKSAVNDTAQRLVPSLLLIGFLCVVCYLNPFVGNAFVLPADVRWGESTSPFASSARISPFSKVYIQSAWESPSLLAYFPLFLLGFFSFWLNRSGWQWQRFFPWFVLAILSVWHVRVIPFFAVVSAPLLAWNLHAFFSQRRSLGLSSPRIWRLAVVLFALVFLVTAWPGWLQAPPYEPRSWAIETPLALERGALEVARLHEEGVLSEQNQGLHLSADSAYAFAWFCRQEKALVDLRWSTLQLELLQQRSKQFQNTKVDHLILYDSDRDRFALALDNLFVSPVPPRFLLVEGDLAVCALPQAAEPQKTTSFVGKSIDWKQRTYQPIEAEKAPEVSNTEANLWWQVFWKKSAPRSLDRDEAIFYLLLAEAHRKSASIRKLLAWESALSTALLGGATTWNHPVALLDASIRSTMIRPPLDTSMGNLPNISRFLVLPLQEQFAILQDDMPSDLLYLAIRASRRALKINPNDAQTHFVLGKSYLRLLYNTQERVWMQRLPQLAQLRRSQASAALQRAVTLQPDLLEAHLGLAQIYQDLAYADLQLKHTQIYFKQTLASKSVDENTFQQMKKSIELLEQEIIRRTERFQEETATLRISDRALTAMQYGLPGKALDLLLQSDISAFGPQGMALELELLVKTGQAKDVRDWTNSNEVEALKTVNYHWLRTQALAALGDYKAAREECFEMIAQDSAGNPAQVRETMTGIIRQIVLSRNSVNQTLPPLLWNLYVQKDFQYQLEESARKLQQFSNITIIQGLLAIEQGEIAEANEAFQRSLDIWKRPMDLVDRREDFVNQRIAETYFPWLNRKKD